MSDQAWAGLLQGLGRGMETFLALQQADEARKRQDALDRERQTRQGMEDYQAGWRDEASLPRVQLPGLSVQHTPAQESFLPPKPPRPDTAPVATDIIDPVRYDTRTGVEGKVFDRVENPIAQAEAAKVRAFQLTQQQEQAEVQRNVQTLVQAGMAPQMAEVVARGLKMPEPEKPVAWQIAQDEQGMYQVHPHTGEARPVVASGRQLKPRQPAPRSSGNGRGPSEGERKARFFYERALPASEIMNTFDNVKALDDIASKTGWLGNWAKTPDGRRLYQAGQVWAMAVLRQDSGGAITDTEMEQYFNTYLPKPGDDEATLEQKRQARAVVTQGLKNLAARALPQESQSAPRAGTVTVNGKTYTVPES